MLWEEFGNITLNNTGIQFYMSLRNKNNKLLEYNQDVMKYLSIYQIRKVKNIPIYEPYYEDIVTEGTKIKPNETYLDFYANGHANHSSFLSTYIEKCSNSSNHNQL